MSYPVMPVSPWGEKVLRWSVRQISSRWDRRRFRRFPAWLYRDDRYWVPPLPGQPAGCYPAGLKSACFLAETTSMIGEDRIAGRVLVFQDSAAARQGRDEVAWFGFFEVVNHPDVAADLLDKAQTWVAEMLPGAVALRGPASPYPWGSYGLLTDGFNAHPAAFMPYNAPYYPEFLQALELEPIQELTAFSLDLAALENSVPAPPGPGITLRPGHPNTLQYDLDRLASLVLGRNPGSIAIAALDHAGWVRVFQEIAGFLDPALCVWLEREGVLLGAMLALPDLNEPAAAARSWPWPLRGLRATVARRRFKGARAFPPFLARDEDPLPLAGALYREVAWAAARRGFGAVEYGPLMREDRALIEPLVELGARPAKSYAVYEKSLA